MGKSKCKIKEKYNWITILLIVLAVVFILGPLYIAVLIAVKDPSEMAMVPSFPEKAASAELCRRLGNDRLSQKIYEYPVYHSCESGIYHSYKLYGSLCDYKKQRQE